MKYNDITSVYELEIPRTIMEKYKRMVYVFDEPILREDKEATREFPLFMNVIPGKDGEITKAQRSTIEWIRDHGQLITHRIEKALQYIADYDLKEILACPENSELVKKYQLSNVDSCFRIFGLHGVAVLTQNINGHSLFELEISYAYDDEHGMSILMYKNKLLAIGQGGEFLNRGEYSIGHIPYCQSYQVEYDKIS